MKNFTYIYTVPNFIIKIWKNMECDSICSVLKFVLFFSSQGIVLLWCLNLYYKRWSQLFRIKLIREEGLWNSLEIFTFYSNLNLSSFSSLLLKYLFPRFFFSSVRIFKLWDQSSLGNSRCLYLQVMHFNATVILIIKIWTPNGFSTTFLEFVMQCRAEHRFLDYSKSKIASSYFHSSYL